MAGKRNERWEKEERRDRAALERILQREVDPEVTIETFSWCSAPAGFEVCVTGQSQPLFVPFGQVVGEKNQLPSIYVNTFNDNPGHLSRGFF